MRSVGPQKIKTVNTPAFRALLPLIALLCSCASETVSQSEEPFVIAFSNIHSDEWQEDVKHPAANQLINLALSDFMMLIADPNSRCVGEELKMMLNDPLQIDAVRAGSSQLPQGFTLEIDGISSVRIVNLSPGDDGALLGEGTSELGIKFGSLKFATPHQAELSFAVLQRQNDLPNQCSVLFVWYKLTKIDDAWQPSLGHAGSK